MTLTLVTVFVDLPKREHNDKRRSVETYMEKGRFLNSVPAKLIVYAEPEYFDRITDLLSSRIEETTIVPFSLEESGYYGFLPTIERTMSVINFNPWKDTPLYLITMWTKYWLLERALSLCTTTHLGWIDFGLSHCCNGIDMASFSNIPDKIRLMALRTWTDEEIDGSGYYQYMRGLVSGGYTTGSVENISWLCKEFDEEIIRCGMAVTDEQIVPKLIRRDPEKFDLYYGDYAQILLHCHGPRTNMEFLKGFIEPRATGRMRDEFLKWMNGPSGSAPSGSAPSGSALSGPAPSGLAR